ncbi:MAG: fatty acid desaturase [Myxococcales bacterium]|nr:fatty acid desaturase [Myxococcales bacterium]
MQTCADRVRHVHKAVLAAEASLREAHPWLRHQDAIGLLLWLGGLAGIGTAAWAYLYAGLPVWATIVAVALSASILHELEHDLIHNLYFKSRVWFQDTMLTGIWLGKVSLNPWTRRVLHLRHHRISGQVGDVEERLIGLGERNLLLRFAVAYLPFIGVPIVLVQAIQDAPDWAPLDQVPLWHYKRWRQRLDLVFGTAPIWLTVLAFSGHAWAVDLLVILVLPNMLRHGCIAMVSSYCHYYGDIALHDVTVQNQILRHWSLLPLQLFAFNFGATHIIHHYVVQQPFYIRQWVRKPAWQALEEIGTRVDDFGVVARANRYTIQAKP